MIATTAPGRPRRPGSWRNGAIVAGSIAAHALVLGYIAFRTLTLDGRPVDTPRIVQLWIEPRPLLTGETARAPEDVAAQAPTDLAASRTLAATIAPRLRDLRLDEEDAPTLPVPRAVAPGAAPAPFVLEGSPGAWRVRPRTPGDRISGGLRTGTVGCASPNLLTAAERAVCEGRFGDRAIAAAPITGTTNPERDADFARQGRRALAEYEARRRPLSGGIGIVGPQDGVGSNFGIGVAGAHLDQSLQPGSTENIRTRRDGPRASGPPLTPGGGLYRERE